MTGFERRWSCLWCTCCNTACRKSPRVDPSSCGRQPAEQVNRIDIPMRKKYTFQPPLTHIKKLQSSVIIH